VAFFPERYGDDLIRVSLDILNQRPVPPAVFVEHKLITPGTVDHYYPNDALAKLVRTEPYDASLRRFSTH
jgi:ribose transport system substrate-binding protein